ncbi:MAG: carotenoid 1,2-hydratase [Woeseiaceae bacterium]|nr:carotenoid 1,2-hydratase [Woeseiaceae bacterium]
MRAIGIAILASLLCAASAGIADDSENDERSRLSELLGGGDDRGYARALQARSFSFPEDHGPHPEYRNEWWYLTGNLDDDDGRRFGFELTFFRFALAPSIPDADSNWRSRDVYIAHLAITDADEKFYVAQRYSRAALGLAGSQSEPFRVWIDDWQIVAGSGAEANVWRLQAGEQDFGLDLHLTAVKPPVLNGINGLSQKSAEPGNASYYYSITRWQTEGSLCIGSAQFTVSGLSWLDREWSSSALAANQQGWDWFALQLSDGSDLMFYNLRLNDGRQDPMSAGTWIGANGEASHIDLSDLEIVVTDHWQSSSGGIYPAAWTLHLPRESLRLELVPVLADQELTTTVRYWEGAVDVSGERDGLPVSGRGYVELTGYAATDRGQ